MIVETDDSVLVVVFVFVFVSLLIWIIMIIFLSTVNLMSSCSEKKKNRLLLTKRGFFGSFSLSLLFFCWSEKSTDADRLMELSVVVVWNDRAVLLWFCVSKNLNEMGFWYCWCCFCCNWYCRSKLRGEDPFIFCSEGTTWKERRWAPLLLKVAIEFDG